MTKEGLIKFIQKRKNKKRLTKAMVDAAEEVGGKDWKDLPLRILASKMVEHFEIKEVVEVSLYLRDKKEN